MARSAQARLTNAQNLDALDEKPTMERSRRAALRRHEKGMDAAYDLGKNTRRTQARSRRGGLGLVAPGPLPDAFPLEEGDDRRQAYEDGARDALDQERRDTARRLGTGTRDQAAKQYRKHAANPIREGSGFLLGLFAYALFLSFMRDGIDGPKQWMKAKFLNETPTTKSAPKPKPATPSSPSSPVTPSATPTARIPFQTVAYVPSSPLPKAGPG